VCKSWRRAGRAGSRRRAAATLAIKIPHSVVIRAYGDGMKRDAPPCVPAVALGIAIPQSILLRAEEVVE